MRHLFLTIFLLSCSAADPGTKTIENKTPEVTCVPSGINDKKNVQVSWSAIKNGDTPVDGTVDGTAVIVPAASGLKGTKVTLTFDPLTIASGIELRDSRIATIFFESSTITYSASITAIDVNSIPSDGERRKVTITGTLMFAGNGTSTIVHGVLENKDGSISLTDDPEQKSAVNVTATPGLKNNVNKLLAVASVSSMESLVTIKGTLPIIQKCE